MELVRSWLLGVTCAAMVVALCDAMTPDGTVKRVGRLAGGLLLLIAILKPVAALDYTALAGVLARYRAESAGYSRALETENKNIMKAIIGEQTSAYILDKAVSLGMDCTVSVICEFGEADFPVPVAVTVSGHFTQEQAAALGRVIEADFAIPPGEQRMERKDVE